jgi:hypothetical protein
MKIGIVLRDLHHDETELARAFVRLAEEHHVDHEIQHLGHDLADWSMRHIREIASVATQFGQTLEPAPDGTPALVDQARRWASERTGRAEDAELVMVRDLKAVYLRASGVLTDWEMVGQAAQEIVHDELVGLATRCQSDTRRQMTWANAKLKEVSTQALVV